MILKRYNLPQFLLRKFVHIEIIMDSECWSHWHLGVLSIILLEVFKIDYNSYI